MRLIKIKNKKKISHRIQFKTREGTWGKGKKPMILTEEGEIKIKETKGKQSMSLWLQFGVGVENYRGVCGFMLFFRSSLKFISGLLGFFYPA